MENNLSTVSRKILISSVVFKFIAMIIGVLGNITVIIHKIFTSKEKTATSYLVGNLALADLLVCLTFYPIWIIEFMQTILNIDSDQDLFCKLSRSSIKALLFASVASLLAITVDCFVYIVKPLKYQLFVTKRRVFVAILGIWVTACCVFIFLLFYHKRGLTAFRTYCDLDEKIYYSTQTLTVYFPLTLMMILNVWILIVAAKQRKRILAETAAVFATSSKESANKRSDIKHFFRALKAAKTFLVVVAMLTFCVLTPTVVGLVLYEISSCSDFCKHLWFVVFNYEFYGMNSIVNAFVYGIRHVKYRIAYRTILFKMFPCY